MNVPTTAASETAERTSTKPTTTTVHLVRHGEVYNPDHVLYERLPEFHLSDRGRRMARATAEYIANDPVINQAQAVFSSPLDRTRETAAPIIEALDKVRSERGQARLPRLVTDERIIEAGNEFRGRRIGHGDGALWRPENLRLIRNLHRPSWGESYAHIAQRMSDFVFEKVDEFAGGSFIAVSHESPIFTFRTFMVTGKPEHWMWQRHTALASVTSLTIDTRTHRLVSVVYADPAADVE